MLDKTPEKTKQSAATPVEDTSVLVGTSSSPVAVYDESDMSSEPPAVEPIAVTIMAHATDKEYDESGSSNTVIEPTLHGYPQDHVQELDESGATATVTELTSLGYPQDHVKELDESGVTTMVTEPTLQGYPQDHVPEMNESGATATVTEISSLGYPQDHVRELDESSTTPVTEPTLRGYPLDIATNEATSQPTPTDPIEQTTPIIPLDHVKPAVIATSVADAFFTETPKPKVVLPPLHTPHSSTSTSDSPPLLLRDVKSDADLAQLRTKYRDRYLELEEMLEYAATCKVN
ncbi:MAG: hypothetical protein R3E08_14130 [Thiotrichaceae bacterium]